jgi:TonB family protein
MPTSEVPVESNDPQGPSEKSSAQQTPLTGAILGLDPNPQPLPEPSAPASPIVSGSRWIDYDTHELLEMISELEDERRWARFREGMLWAVLLHIILISAITWIPTYVFKVPKVIDPFEAIKQRKDLTYLDMPPDVLRKPLPKVAPRPLSQDKPLIDKKTMDEMKRQAPPPPVEQPQAQTPEQTKPQVAPSVQPSQPSQAQVEAPHPAAVPAKPNFAFGSQNPADQLREDMRNAMRGHGQQTYGAPSSGRGGSLSLHPGAGTGGVEVLSDTQGVDFTSWLSRWHYITERTWDPLIPDEANPPISKKGIVAVRFKVLPNGQVTEMQLDGRSGDTGYDRAAWGAITGSNYPPLPREFHGPYLELRAYFLYNVEPR